MSLTIPETVFAGATAGLAELMVMHPLDTVKTRMQLITSSSTAAETSVVGTLRALWTQGGVSRLYRGLLAPAAQEPVKRAAKFTFNAKYNKMIIGDGQASWAKKTLCGAMAGATEAVTIQPFEFLKIRMQAANRVDAYANTMDAVKKIAQSEGITAFATGLEPALWRSATWNGTFFGLLYLMDKTLPEAESKPGEFYFYLVQQYD
jgi:solute carrier family 25 2-oxodicarboxylate transporter 21